LRCRGPSSPRESLQDDQISPQVCRMSVTRSTALSPSTTVMNPTHRAECQNISRHTRRRSLDRSWQLRSAFQGSGRIALISTVGSVS
jgi:hypothetical protein